LGWSALTFDGNTEFDILGDLQSQFAAKTIDVALRAAWQKEAKTLKLKTFTGGIAGLFILGLGKLGGRDLNFSSDVDLVAFYDPAILPIPEHIGQGYIVNKILKTMGQILKPRHSSNFVWRVDWRLRPEASITQLAMPIDMAQDFYFFRALPWHRLALMKARVIAGDIKTGETFLTSITPFIWRQNLDFRALDELAHLKSRINLEHPALRQQRATPDIIGEDAAGFNVKLGSGGIREIEFIANAQQLVWGGKQYDLRTPNTLEALTNLASLGHLNETTAETLKSCYIGLRNLENTIQILDNAQNHIVPSSTEQQRSIMDLLGENDWPKFCKKIKKMRQFVNTEFKNVFDEQIDLTSTSTEFETTFSELSPAVQDIAKNWLDGFNKTQASSSNNIKFQRLGMSLLSSIFKSSADSELAIGRVNTFLSALSRSDQYLHLLARNEALLNALVPPLLYSPHMTILLQQSPHIIDVFLSPIRDMDTDFIFQTEDYETRLERLRRFVNENLFTHYTNFMGIDGTPHALHKNLTHLANLAIEASLKIVSDDLSIPELPMTVLGLGKMGTSRMSPKSDLDLIFIFKDGTDSDLAQKIVRRLRTVLTAKLREGIAYDLDMRLRPSGRSGPPAVMLSSFKDHHYNRAHNWEHIALSHSRIIAGDENLGKTVMSIAKDVLSRPRNHTQFLSDAQTMWHRISTQRISETTPSDFNSKLRHGGLMQAEYSQACAQILDMPLPTLSGDIKFWSHIQLWERLLELTLKSLSDIPDFYKANLLRQFQAKSLSALEKQQKHHSQSVQAAFNHLFSGAEPSPSHQEGRIIWQD